MTPHAHADSAHPILRLSEAQYALLPPDARGIWTTERDDLPGWAEVRDQYMGKRTMLSSAPCRLLIEGLGFEVIEDRHPHQALMSIANALETLKDLYLQVEWVQTANDRRQVAGVSSALDVIDAAPLEGEVTVELSYPGGRCATLRFDLATGGWLGFESSGDVREDLRRLRDTLSKGGSQKGSV